MGRFSILTLLLAALPAGTVASEATCQAGQLAAAANFCARALTCESRFVKQPSRDPSGARLSACLAAAGNGLAGAYGQALRKEQGRGGQCKLNESATTVAARWRGKLAGTDGLIPFLLQGWDGTAAGNPLYASQLLDTGVACKTLLDAQAANARRPNAAQLAARVARAQAALVGKLDRARARAARKGYVYAGPASQAIAAATGGYAEALAADTGGPGIPPPTQGLNQSLQGKLYFGSAAGVQEVDLASGIRRTLRKGGSAVGVSRDGRILAMRDDALGGDRYYAYDLVIFGLDGVPLTRFTFPIEPNNAGLGAIRFSPDGQLLIFNSQFSSPTIFTVLRLSDGGIVVNYNDSGNSRVSAAWLPDGRLLLASGTGLAITDATLTRLTPFASLPDIVTTLDMSPDGARIAFAMAGHIWTMNGDGSGLKQATDSSCHEHNPGFSPDGRFLVLSYCPSGGLVSQSGGRVWVVPAGGERVWVGEQKPTAAMQIRALDDRGRTLPVVAISSLSWR